MYNVYGDSAFLVFNGTSLNSDIALLALNWRLCKFRTSHKGIKAVAFPVHNRLYQCDRIYHDMETVLLSTQCLSPIFMLTMHKPRNVAIFNISLYPYFQRYFDLNLFSSKILEYLYKLHFLWVACDSIRQVFSLLNFIVFCIFIL